MTTPVCLLCVSSRSYSRVVEGSALSTLRFYESYGGEWGVDGRQGRPKRVTVGKGVGRRRGEGFIGRNKSNNHCRFPTWSQRVPDSFLLTPDEGSGRSRPPPERSTRVLSHPPPSPHSLPPTHTPLPSPVASFLCLFFVLSSLTVTRLVLPSSPGGPYGAWGFRFSLPGSHGFTLLWSVRIHPTPPYHLLYNPYQRPGSPFVFSNIFPRILLNSQSQYSFLKGFV